MTPVGTVGTVAPRRLGAVAALGAAGVAGLAYVASADPHDPGVPMPICPWHALTGLDCPGCGGLRMTHDLLDGQLGAAFADNAVLLVLAPLLMFLLGRAVVRYVAGRPPSAATRRTFEVRGPLGWAVVAIGLGWAVVRNIAGW